jgi:DNA-binding transcriptional ArsR family regulator
MQKKSNYRVLEWPHNLIADIEGRRETIIAPIDPLPEDFTGSLEYVLHSLPNQKSVEVLRLRYQHHMPYEAIAAEVGISQARVGQLLEYARREIRKPEWIQYLRYGVQGIIEQQRQQQKEIYQKKVEFEVWKDVEADRNARKEAEEAEKIKPYRLKIGFGWRI